MSKPKPVAERLVCSECELDWNLHPENPRRRDCIELLKENHERIVGGWWSQFTSTHSNTFIDPSNVIRIATPTYTDDDDDPGVSAKVS